MFDERPPRRPDQPPHRPGLPGAPARGPRPLVAAPEQAPSPAPAPEPPLTGVARLWADLRAAGWHEAILRYATHGLVLAVIALAVWVRQVDLRLLDALAARARLDLSAAALAGAAAAPEPAATGVPAGRPPALSPVLALPPDTGAITRLADAHTTLPTRGRSTVITYTVQKGDTLFGIAEKFGLKPETVLWGNYFVLKDDPHTLRPDQVLNILPVDGTYHFVTPGNTLEQIAKFYRVTPQAIADWPGNRLESDQATPAADTWLVVPGGARDLQVWVVPTITRSTRTSATRVGGGFGAGSCPGGYSGAVGDGVFAWPADSRTLSGYDYSAIHHGLDIRAGLGAPLYATDSGVIVFAGPNDYGYGNLIVIDHGNGWQSVYGHLSQWNVSCGQSVFRGNLIGLAGSTGRSSGPHLHFELRYNGAYVNPWDMLP